MWQGCQNDNALTDTSDVYRMTMSEIILSRTLQLRPLTPADHPVLQALMQRIYPPAYAHLWPDGGAWYLRRQYGRANYLRELAEPNAVYHFVLHYGEPTGIVRLVKGTSLVDQPTVRACKLHRIYLDQAIHGQGIGKQIIQWTIDTCRQQGFDLLWLEAMDTAPAALAFYERMGFTRSGAFRLDMPLMYPSLRGMYRLALPL